MMRLKKLRSHGKALLAQLDSDLHRPASPTPVASTGLLSSAKIRLDILLLILLTAGIYLFFWSISDTSGNDTVTRSLMAWRWLKKPFLIWACNDITWVFGPFHCYLNVIAILLTGNPLWGPRLASGLFGAMTAIPLYLIVSHYFGRRAAFYSGLAFPFFTFFIGLSVSGNSEPISSFFILWAIYFAIRFRENEFLSHIIASGLLFSLAAATRYDVWIFGPVLFIYLLWIYYRNRSRVVLKGLIFFALIAASFPVAWIIGNYHLVGDPLIFLKQAYDPLPFSGHFDIRLAKHILYDFALFPSALMFGLTPAVFLIAIFGFYRTLKEKRRPDRFPAIILLVLIFWYMSFFVIGQKMIAVSRMMVNHGLFLLIFFGPGMTALLSILKPARQKILLVSTFLMAVLFAILPPFSVLRPAALNSRLIPLSQYVPAPPEIKSTGNLLHRQLESGKKIMLDCKDMAQRSIMLRLFEHENGIIQFYGTPSEFIPDIKIEKPDIIVLSRSNRHLNEIQASWITTSELQFADINYVLDRTIGNFLIFSRKASDGRGSVFPITNWRSSQYGKFRALSATKFEL
ncbi:membrane hypothetical protein [Candidatus Zixiibacteriota bacterium]|nr:membrane hypothetical protein [candidate division Zixibacteria bacterium]